MGSEVCSGNVDILLDRSNKEQTWAASPSATAVVWARATRFGDEDWREVSLSHFLSETFLFQVLLTDVGERFPMFFPDRKLFDRADGEVVKPSSSTLLGDSGMAMVGDFHWRKTAERCWTDARYHLSLGLPKNDAVTSRYSSSGRCSWSGSDTRTSMIRNSIVDRSRLSLWVFSSSRFVVNSTIENENLKECDLQLVVRPSESACENHYTQPEDISWLHFE